MERVAKDRAGRVLLEVKFSRLRSTVILLVGIGLVGGMAGLLLAADRTSWGKSQWLFASLGLLLGGLILIASVRQLLLPADMITATEKGLLLHLYGNRYVRAGCLIRWSDIEKLSLETVCGWQGGDRRRFKTIVVSLEPDAPVPSAAVDYGPSGPGRSIRIDASNGSLRGEELLRNLENLRRRSR